MEKYPKKTDGIVYRNPDSFFGYCGWPSVCQDENGTLYAAYSVSPAATTAAKRGRSRQS